MRAPHPAPLPLYLATHQVSARTAGIVAALALTAVALQFISLPDLNPDPAIARPLETLGTVFGLVIAGLCGSWIRSACPEFEAGRSASLLPFRLLLMSMMPAVCLLIALAVGSLGPAGLSWHDALRTYLLITGTHVVSLIWLGSLGFAVPFALVGVSSIAGLLPWSVNLLYNLDTAPMGWAVTAALWTVATAALLAGRGSGAAR